MSGSNMVIQYVTTITINTALIVESSFYQPWHVWFKYAAMTNRRRGKESDHVHGRSCVCWFLGIMLQGVLLFYVMRSRA